MSYALLIGVDARTDLAEITAYYNAEKLGLGNEFVAQVYDTIQQITHHPKAFAIVHKRLGFRKKKVSRFPFDVFYKVKTGQKTVVVVAVIHQSRDPQVWKERKK